MAVDQPSEEDLKGGLTSIQLIVEFEMQTWKVSLEELRSVSALISTNVHFCHFLSSQSQDLIEAFDITQPMIPTRKVANTGPVQAGKWYA